MRSGESRVVQVEHVQGKETVGELLTGLLTAAARVALVTLVAWGVVLSWFPEVQEAVTPLDVALVVIALRALFGPRPPRVVG